jgi:hypothetical protein
MSDIEKEDALARKVRERRERAEGINTPQQIPVSAQTALKPTLAENLPKVEIQQPAKKTEFNVSKIPAEKLTNLIAAMDRGENPLAVARLIADILTGDVKNIALAHELKVSPPWISKRLSLLSAPQEVQKLIEAGSISETEYYNNREHVEKQVTKKKGQTLKYQRMPTVTISIEAAQTLAELLQKIATQQNLTPIKIEKNATKKELTSILNFRTSEIARAFK